MNEASRTVQRLSDILQKETELMESFEMTERAVMNSVLNNSWDTLESSLSRADGLALRIESLDRRELNLSESLGK